jgi:hypothetical protein
MRSPDSGFPGMGTLCNWRDMHQDKSRVPTARRQAVPLVNAFFKSTSVKVAKGPKAVINTPTLQQTVARNRPEKVRYFCK